MEPWITILLPFVLIMARVAGFVFVSPILGWRAVPVVCRVGIVLLLTVFFAAILPPGMAPAGVHWLGAVVGIAQESVIGLALGLAARFVYSAVQQGGMIAAQQMGFADSGIIDPVSGTTSRPIATLFEMVFALLFLAAGGHHILLLAIKGSFSGFPLGAAPDISALAEGVVTAGSAMLLFALRLSAAILAGFLIMAVLLCVLVRVLPEMNILMISFPLRMAVGLFMAAAVVPSLNGLTMELAEWMREFLLA